MPLPSSTHIDTFASGILLGTTNEGMIADDVMPPIFSNKLTGKVAKMGEEHYRVDFVARQVGTPGYMIDFDVSSVSFDIEEFRLEFPIDDVQKDQYDDPYDAVRDGSMVVKQKLMLKKELLVSALLTTTGNYASGHTDTSGRSWNTPATGLPVDDVQTAIEKIISKKGVSEDNLYGFCSYKVYKMLRQNNQIKNVFLNTSPGASAVGALSRAQIATCLGLAGLSVSPSIQNTAKKGATASKSYVWGASHFGVFYKPQTAGIMVPGFAYQVFPKIPILPGGQVVIDRYREERLTSDIIRGRMLLDQIVGDSELGFLYTNVT
jgi:hypothetical protein